MRESESEVAQSCPALRTPRTAAHQAPLSMGVSRQEYWSGVPFALIRGPNILGSYAILLFTALGLASITSHIHSWVFFLLWLHPFIIISKIPNLYKL